MNKNIKKILGYTIMLVHTICYLLLVIYPLFTKNIIVLLLANICISLIFFGWYYNNGCFLTPIENWCLDKKNDTYKNGIQKSIIIDSLYNNKYENLVKNSLMIVPILSIINNSYNIYKNCKKKKN